MKESAFLFGVKEDTQAKIEVLLLKRKENDIWETLVKPGKKAKPGTKLVFGDGLLTAEVVLRLPYQSMPIHPGILPGSVSWNANITYPESYKMPLSPPLAALPEAIHRRHPLCKEIRLVYDDTAVKTSGT